MLKVNSMFELNIRTIIFQLQTSVRTFNFPLWRDKLLSFNLSGPRLFMSCPMDIAGSQVWFTDLWNYTLVETVRKGLQVHYRLLISIVSIMFSSFSSLFSFSSPSCLSSSCLSYSSEIITDFQYISPSSILVSLLVAMHCDNSSLLVSYLLLILLALH